MSQDRCEAIVVAHGVGQQHPFEVLDEFSQGLRRALRNEGYTVRMLHRHHHAEDAVQHSVRLEAENHNDTALGRRTIDIFEYYWAPKTQGVASFRDVVRWVRVTAFTPLRRFAYNLDLLRQRAATGGREATDVSYAWSLATELGRVVGMLVLCLGVALGATWLVGQAPSATGSVTRVGTSVLSWLKGAGALDKVRTAGFAVAAVSFVVLVGSLWPQWRDLVRLRRRLLKPQDRRTATRLAFFMPSPAVIPEGIRARVRSAKWFARYWRAVGATDDTLFVEVRARLRFLRYSMIGIPVLAFTMWSLVPAPVLKRLLGQRASLTIALGIVLGAALIKRVFVDYIADIAVYASADENSAYFKTRTEILDDVTRELRWVLREREYTAAAVAGHSLGSVIVYDAVSRLRVESQAPNALLEAQQVCLDEIRTMFAAASAQSPALEALLARLREATVRPARVTDEDPSLAGIESELQALARQAGVIDVDRIERAVRQLRDACVAVCAPNKRAAAPITPAEFRGMSTLVTFGSPLDKFVYFFRTQLRGYDVVRAHILDELHGFRRLPRIDPRSTPMDGDRPPFEPDDKSLWWLNVSSYLDPVSSPLRFFECDDRLSRPYFPWWGVAHTKYWHDSVFYRAVLAALDRRRASP